MSKLLIKDLHMSYGTVEVLKGIDASLEEGSVICLLGRSGSGKTTLLRAIAGLVSPSRGVIEIDGRAVFDSSRKLDVPPEARGLGLVFQSYALWPHRTVYENVAYGLKLRRVPASEIARRVAAVLDGVGLGDFAKRYPHELSGGQQQRVALARALVYEPPVILLDEPLSNLDAKLREEARVWMRGLIKRLGLTAVLVTHDQLEAMAIADEIVLLDGGRIVQVGKPVELYTQPNSVFVSEFMGSNNSVQATVTRVEGRMAEVRCGDAILRGENRTGIGPGAKTTIVIRVEAVTIAESGGENTLEGELESSIYVGGRYEHFFRVGNDRWRALGDQLSPGRYALHLPANHLWIF